MSKLVIRVSGTVEQSNFEEWKSELLASLDVVKTDLSNDNDFAQAADQVKAFKTAETTLKKARESALKQSEDISTLFAAIDEVAQKTREVRLTLERQIRSRKEEIKDQAVDEAVARVKTLLAEQDETFKQLNHRDLLDRDIFEDAIKGTRSTKGMHKALKEALQGIAAQIDRRAERARANTATLDGLNPAQQLLFQDRTYVLTLEPDALNALIDERVAAMEEAAGSSAPEEPPKEREQAEAPEFEDSVFAVAGEEADVEVDEAVEEYSIIIRLNTTATHARALMVAIQGVLEEDESVQGMDLLQS